MKTLIIVMAVTFAVAVTIANADQTIPLSTTASPPAGHQQKGQQFNNILDEYPGYLRERAKNNEKANSCAEEATDHQVLHECQLIVEGH